MKNTISKAEHNEGKISNKDERQETEYNNNMTNKTKENTPIDINNVRQGMKIIGYNYIYLGQLPCKPFP